MGFEYFKNSFRTWIKSHFLNKRDILNIKLKEKEDRCPLQKYFIKISKTTSLLGDKWYIFQNMLLLNWIIVIQEKITLEGVSNFFLRKVSDTTKTQTVDTNGNRLES